MMQQFAQNYSQKESMEVYVFKWYGRQSQNIKPA